MKVWLLRWTIGSLDPKSKNPKISKTKIPNCKTACLPMYWWFVWLSNWTAYSAYSYVFRATYGLESLWRITYSLIYSPIYARIRLLLRYFFLLYFLLYSNVLFTQVIFSLPFQFLVIIIGPIPLILQSFILKVTSLPFLVSYTFIIITLSLSLD
jgi:hypothetical protein